MGKEKPRTYKTGLRYSLLCCDAGRLADKHRGVTGLVNLSPVAQ